MGLVPVTDRAEVRRLSAPMVHPAAIVERGAGIGERSGVWHHAHIRGGARIGDDCNLGKNLYDDGGAAVGNSVKLQNNVSVYTGQTIEDRVFVGPSAAFTNVRYPRPLVSRREDVDTMIQVAREAMET